MNRFFVDASFWIALELVDDQNHDLADSYWASFDLSATYFVTTTYVLDEVVTFLNSRNAHPNAVSIGESLLLSPQIDLIHVDEDLFFEGWHLFRKYDDKKFSLTDCISFVTMVDRKLEKAITFDVDFKQAGFLIEPK